MPQHFCWMAEPDLIYQKGHAGSFKTNRMPFASGFYFMIGDKQLNYPQRAPVRN
jgi:hypothetical protein